MLPLFWLAAARETRCVVRPHSGLFYGEEAEMGRRMTAHWFGWAAKGCFCSCFQLLSTQTASRRETFRLCFFRSQRKLGGYPQVQVTGICSGRIGFGTRLATDWSWTRRVACGSAGLGAAALAARGAVLTSVSCTPSQAILYSHGPCA